MDELIYILLGLTSVVGLAFIVERALALRWNKVVPPGIAAALASCETREDVKTLCAVCRRKPSPLGRLLLLAVDPSRLAKSRQRGRAANRRAT